MTEDEDFDSTAFDEAAENAEVELLARIGSFSPQQREILTEIQIWWEKWYQTAGHRRLGRIILRI